MKEYRENERKRLKYQNRKPIKWAGKVWREKPHVRVQLGKN